MKDLSKKNNLIALAFFYLWCHQQKFFIKNSKQLHLIHKKREIMFQSFIRWELDAVSIFLDIWKWKIDQKTIHGNNSRFVKKYFHTELYYKDLDTLFWQKLIDNEKTFLSVKTLLDKRYRQIEWIVEYLHRQKRLWLWKSFDVRIGNIEKQDKELKIKYDDLWRYKDKTQYLWYELCLFHLWMYEQRCLVTSEESDILYFNKEELLKHDLSLLLFCTSNGILWSNSIILEKVRKFTRDYLVWGYFHDDINTILYEEIRQNKWYDAVIYSRTKNIIEERFLEWQQENVIETWKYDTFRIYDFWKKEIEKVIKKTLFYRSKWMPERKYDIVYENIDNAILLLKQKVDLSYAYDKIKENIKKANEELNDWEI